jgi:catalase (peroxidase I)
MAGGIKWVGTRVDLILVPIQIRALAEVYGYSTSQKNLCMTLFAWTKVMNLDRFDLV